MLNAFLTSDTPTAHYLGHHNDQIEDILFREDTFMSLKSRSLSTPLPPVTTTLGLIPTELPPMPGTPEPPREKRAVTPTPRSLTPTPCTVTPQQANPDSHHLAFTGPKDVGLGTAPGSTLNPAETKPEWR